MLASPPPQPFADSTTASDHLESASDGSWSAGESTDQSSDSESVANSHAESELTDDDGDLHMLSAKGNASPQPPQHGRRTPEFTLPDSPLRSFRARPPGHHKRPSQIRVLTNLTVSWPNPNSAEADRSSSPQPAKDARATAASSAVSAADDSSSPISPGTDWKNFLQLFKNARTSLGPSDAISAALNSPTKRPVRSAHSRTSSRATTYESHDDSDSDSSEDEDRVREETLRKAAEYFLGESPSDEGAVEHAVSV